MYWARLKAVPLPVKFFRECQCLFMIIHIAHVHKKRNALHLKDGGKTTFSLKQGNMALSTWIAFSLLLDAGQLHGCICQMRGKMELCWDLVANASARVVGKGKHKCRWNRIFSNRSELQSSHMVWRIYPHTGILMGAVSNKDFPFTGKDLEPLLSFDSSTDEESTGFCALGSFSVTVSDPSSD